METPFPAAHGAGGVTIQPRKFEFRDLDAVPQYWFAGNPILSHVENAFSILIPPGERFFIRSVRRFSDRAKTAEQADLIRAFTQQEGLHMRAHAELNESFKRFGVDVDREVAAAEDLFARVEKKVPWKIQLGMTAFLEHMTAVGALALFIEPVIAQSMHPEMVRFWRWHAAEELEHRSVAFDLFCDAGGGYGLRVLSALTAIVLLARPFVQMARRMIRDDPHRITPEDRRRRREIDKKTLPPQLRMIARYFKPGFHPRDVDAAAHLADWYASPA